MPLSLLAFQTFLQLELLCIMNYALKVVALIYKLTGISLVTPETEVNVKRMWRDESVMNVKQIWRNESVINVKQIWRNESVIAPRRGNKHLAQGNTLGIKAQRMNAPPGQKPYLPIRKS